MSLTFKAFQCSLFTNWAVNPYLLTYSQFNPIKWKFISYINKSRLQVRNLKSLKEENIEILRRKQIF